MTVEFDRENVMNHFKQKRQRVMLMTAHQGVNIASLNMGYDYKRHIDTGASSNAKHFTPETLGLNNDTVRIETGTDYDIYLERRYGIMARVADMIKPYMMDYIEKVFNV